MPDAKTRLQEAERALQDLEIDVEQYRIHLEELTAQPYEEEKARAVLAKFISRLRSQRTYCDLLRNAVQADALNGSSPSRARG